MKRQSSYGKLGIILVCLLVLVLAACGSADENIAEPQADQAALQATSDALQATADASGAASAVTQPTSTETAPTASTPQTTPTSDASEVGSSGTGAASLSDLIVGSWLDTSPDDSDLLDFLPDGRFFMDSGVDSVLTGALTYEVVGEDTIVLTDHRFAQDNTSTIVVGEITQDSMTLLQNPWSGGQVTFKKLKGADNLPSELPGLWLLESVESPPADGTQTDIWFDMMVFGSDGAFLGGDTGTTYQILSNSAIALLNQAWDQSSAIRVHEISDDQGSFQFEIWDSAVLYRRHREDDQLKARLVGVWGGAMEFTEDGQLIDKADNQVYSYQVYDDGTVVTLRGSDLVNVNQVRFKSDNEIYWCYPLHSETGSLLWECGGEDNTVTRTEGQ